MRSEGCARILALGVVLAVKVLTFELFGQKHGIFQKFELHFKYLFLCSTFVSEKVLSAQLGTTAMQLLGLVLQNKIIL